MSRTLIEAEKVYSQFALEALLVEGEGLGHSLASVLYEFAGADAIVTNDEVLSNIDRAGVDKVDIPRVVEALRTLSFLGIEVRDGEFEFNEAMRDLLRSDALARRLGDARGSRSRYRIHPAFRPFLEISDNGDPLLESK